MRTQNSQSRRWVFTLNNPSDAEWQAFRNLADELEEKGIRYVVGGDERGESGTRHIQGFVIFHQPKRFSAVRGLWPRAHIEPARGSSRQAADYCKKDGTYIEFGDMPDSQGRRRDIEEAVSWADNFTLEAGRAPTSPEIARAYPSIYLRYPRVTRLFENRSGPPVLEEGEPNDWQRELEAELNGEVSPRGIQFYVDPEGGKGKTWFQQYYMTKYPEKTQILSVGKRDDLAHVIDRTKSVFFFNMPRGGMEFFQYVVAEALKDRMVFSPKYSSHMKFLARTPHVVVFCNEHPEMNKMSADRYLIHEI